MTEKPENSALNQIKKKKYNYKPTTYNKNTGKLITKPTRYTKQYMLKELKSLYKELINDKDIMFKGTLFEKRPYTMDSFCNAMRRAKDNKQLNRIGKKIDEVIESRLFKYGLKRTFKPTMAIFCLKAKYGWSDRQAIEHSGTISIQPVVFRPQQEKLPVKDDKKQ